MRVKSIIITILFLSLSAGYSQIDTTRIFKTHSLQFRTSNLLSLSSFKGNFISYKFHPTDNHAYRVGLSVNAKNADENETLDYQRTIDTTFKDHNRNHNDILIELMVEYIMYFNLKNDLKMFLGIGPRLYFNLHNFDTDNFYSEDTSYEREYKNNRYQAGLTFSYGLEWFFRENMSLHAEYGFNASYFHDEYKRLWIYLYDDNSNGLVKNSEVRKGFEINDTNALLGLSLYF